jgi:hypothetical protein
MSAGSAAAQDIFGRITGTVTDPTGAAIPNAVVSVTNQATKVTRTVKADSQGFYVASELSAGTYDVSAEGPGFKSTKSIGNDVTAGGRRTVDLHLEVGAVTETVTLTAIGETVNTITGEISHTIDAHQVQDLALNQRNYAQLVSLIPGAALTNFDQTAMTTGMSTTASSVNGLRADSNLFTVDGGFNLDSGSNATQLNNVGIDFIREVAVQSSNYSAEYGRMAGASVNVVTKSGGTNFHGGAFEFVRNDIFDAINSASKLNAAPGTPVNRLKPALRFNDFGWNLGGPILRGKLFFFAGEEWKKLRISANPQSLTVPTSAELKGDFRDVLSGLTLTTPANAPAGCTITNNVMSPQCISADGKAIANVYAGMTQTASTFSDTPSANNALFQPVNPQEFREDIIRIDYNINANQNVYFRYIHDNLNLIDGFGTFAPGGTLPTSPTNRVRPGLRISSCAFVDDLTAPDQRGQVKRILEQAAHSPERKHLAAWDVRISISVAVPECRSISRWHSSRNLYRRRQRISNRCTRAVHRSVFLPTCSNYRHFSFRKRDLAGGTSHCKIWRDVRSQSQGPELAA